MATNIQVQITFNGKTLTRTVHSTSKVGQWLRRMERRQYVGDSARVTVKRGAEVQRTTFGNHPVIRDVREEQADEQAA